MFLDISLYLHKILDFGNALMSILGLATLFPLFVSIGDKVFDYQKSKMISGYLNENSVNFLLFIHPFSCGVNTDNGF